MRQGKKPTPKQLAYWSRNKRVSPTNKNYGMEAPASQPVPLHHQFDECQGCKVRQEMIEHLKLELQRVRDINGQLENKFMAMVGPAADSYNRMRMTELAHVRPAMFSQSVSRDDIMVDPEQEAAEFIMKGAMGITS